MQPSTAGGDLPPSLTHRVVGSLRGCPLNSAQGRIALFLLPRAPNLRGVINVASYGTWLHVRTGS